MFVDPQSSEHTLQTAGMRAFLGQVDIFAPNEHEARMLTGLDNLDDVLGCLVEATRLLLVKRGPDGALAADRNGQIQAPGLPVRVVETTGAGDCFNAGFLMALVEGSSLGECLRAGNAAGALSSRAPSSLGIPSRRELEEVLRAV